MKKENLHEGGDRPATIDFHDIFANVFKNEFLMPDKKRLFRFGQFQNFFKIFRS